jgi:hypothetical protein
VKEKRSAVRYLLRVVILGTIVGIVMFLLYLGIAILQG